MDLVAFRYKKYILLRILRKKLKKRNNNRIIKIIIMEVKNRVMENINNESLNDFYELLGEKAVLVKDDKKKNKENINNESLDELLGDKNDEEINKFIENFDMESYENFELFRMGKNEEGLKKQITYLENKERNEEENKKLFKYRNELGLSNEGKTKGKMCWDYVKKNNCNHMSKKNLEEGKTLGGKWHPNKEEKEYLKRKKGWN
jgi:hypothetical protein